MKRKVQILLQATVVLTLLGIGLNASAQPSVVTEVPVSSTGFVTIGDLVYFTSGNELWRTDGTGEGTFVLGGFAQLRSFTEFQNDLYFLSNQELWRTDGTRGGTIQLHISSTTDNLSIRAQTNDDLFFQDASAATGLELYRTDGTASGTGIVKDINPGSGNGFAYIAAAVGNYLFFSGNNGTEGQELWKSDGSAAGTVMVEDINPGAADGFESGAGVDADNNLFYFAGTTPEAAGQPWVSDGTPEGTYQLQNIPYESGVAPYLDYRLAHDGVMYFLVSHWQDSRTELWTSRGTPESTSEVKDIGFDEVNHSFLAYKDKIYFFKSIEPYEHLWVTDGTEEGTKQILSIAGDNSLDYFDVVNGHLLFSASDGGYSFRFFRSDGTEAGTETFTQFKAVTTYPQRRDLTTVNDFTFYADHDGPADEGGNAVNEADYLHLFQANGFTTQSMRTLFGVSTVGANDITDYNGKVIFTTYDDRNGATSNRKLLWLYDQNNPPPTPTFTLVNADTDEDVQTINNDDVLTLPEDMNINIRFNAVGNPGSVKLAIGGGGTVRTENEAPFTLAGDNNGDYYAWSGGGSGTYTLYAYPFSEDGGKGEQGTMAEVHFEIVRTPAGGNCSASGTILREYWDNVSGNNVSAIPVSSPPTSTSQLSIFEAPSNVDTNYGARIRGYICAPITGDYTFWIASNDHSELWLGPADDLPNRKRIAYVTGATNPRQWDKFASQQSAPVTLAAGQRYYIEALHKQGVGTDNLAVGWQLPDGTMERPIAGNRLSPFTGSGGDNLAPQATITNPGQGQTYDAPADILIEVDATDPEGRLTKVEFFRSPSTDGHDIQKIGEDVTAPYSFTWQDAGPGDYVLTAEAIDDQGVRGLSPRVFITVNSQCGSGVITREFWTGVEGNRVSDIPVDTPPNGSHELTSFEGPVNWGTSYGARIRGYICPPITGNYIFYISSNDHSELWLSQDDDPSKKTRIAYVYGATSFREFDRFPANQVSGLIMLTAGQRYYIEALHKQGSGSDHISVMWRIPNGVFEEPIPGNRLSPFETDGVMAMSQEESNLMVTIHPNPSTSNFNIEVQSPAEESIKLVVTDQYGQLITTYEVTSDSPMQIGSELQRGIYIMKVIQGGEISMKRVVKK
jgi:ELWxxDGT repeat protein